MTSSGGLDGSEYLQISRSAGASGSIGGLWSNPFPISSGGELRFDYMIHNVDDSDYSLTFTMGRANDEDAGAYFYSYPDRFEPRLGAALNYDRVLVASGTESVVWGYCSIIFGDTGCAVEFNGIRQYLYEASGTVDMSTDCFMWGFNVSGIDSSAGEFVGVDNLTYFVLPEPTPMLLFCFGGFGVWFVRRHSKFRLMS